MAQRKADSYGKTLYDLIEAGNGSITDTTLIRRFSPSHPENIVYETRSKVYLNRHLNEYDALLDLAHELTHFVYRKGFNPYKKNFSLSDFIKNTIEGKGGEVQAFMTECRVLYDLFPRKLTSRYNCKQIIDPATGKLSYAKAVDRFYSIGSYFPKFHTRLSNKGILESFPSISSDEITFVSSAYGVPYPIAAYHEYMTVMTKVCENDKKRISYLTQSLSSGRKPASTNISQVQQEYLDRCTGIKIE